MPKGTCSVDGCDLPHFGHGFCMKHHRRWYVHGDPLKVLRVLGLSLDERFWGKVDKRGPNDCWLWTAKVTNHGYARIGNPSVSAHRYSYEQLVGPIPEGLKLDHVCHNEAAKRGDCVGGDSCLHRRCVNPTHLEPVTQGENTRRGLTGVHQKSKTHCVNGHEFTEENTRQARGQRFCVTCTRKSSRESNQRRRDREKAEKC